MLLSNCGLEVVVAVDGFVVVFDVDAQAWPIGVSYIYIHLNKPKC